jgi:sugar (pentulose or hexulose) kinase
MGTAEALLGAFAERPLTEADYQLGLMYGCHVYPGLLYWIGGLSASGGSIEWLLAMLGDPALTYHQLEQLLEGSSWGPTGILYFPYLLGSGSPHSDPRVRGAWIALDYKHTRADLALSILEGAAYEAEVVRTAGQQASGQAIQTLVAAGGGTRNLRWLQIKADVSGCTYEVPGSTEATLLGAALLAGLGAGIYASEPEMRAAVVQEPAHIITPDQHRHDQYRSLYENGYLAFQQPLRQYFGKAFV